MSSTVYRVTHSDPSLKTVGEFVNDMGSIAFAYASDINAFGKVFIREGWTNKNEVIANLPELKRAKEEAKQNFADVELPVGTNLAIEIDKVDRNALLTEGIEIVSHNVGMFKAGQLADLESDKGYKPVTELKNDNTASWAGTTMQQYPNATVWIWTKALSDRGDEEHKGKIFDLSPYITQLTTSVAVNGGGQFHISLAPVNCEYVDEKWVLRTASRKSYVQVKDSKSAPNFFFDGNMYQQKENGAADAAVPGRTQFLFNTIISPNDVVFIRFETLELEKNQREMDMLADLIYNDQLPNRIYDMIGLVDKASIQINGGATDVSIDILGRDLSKLLFDDGCYFFTQEFSKGTLGIAGSAANNNPLMRRVISDMSLYALGKYTCNSLAKILQFVMQQLSTLRIVSDDLFLPYGERRNTRYDPIVKGMEQNDLFRKEQSRFKTAAINKITEIRWNERVYLPEDKQETQQVELVFQEAIRFLKHIRQEHVRTIGANQYTNGWNDTLYMGKDGQLEEVSKGDLPCDLQEGLYSSTRKSRATVNSERMDELIPFLDNYITVQERHPVYYQETNRISAKGIWQIVKLVIDENISARRVIDGSLSSATGSLINLFRKVVQYPFVEYHMDTYGDMYYVMLRKAPFDRISLLTALAGNVRTEKENGKSGEKAAKQEDRTVPMPQVVDIEPQHVLSESLEFSDTEAISWYQLIPKATPFGQDNTISSAFLPAVYLEEYAQQFGARSMQLTHNYLPGIALNGKPAVDLDVVLEQSFYDLSLMIESTAYLPFTRRGTITINRDRRIKVGNFIRYKPTGEIYYVEAVQHSLSVTENGVDAVTTIQVSRGMVEQLIYGVRIETKSDGKSVASDAMYASYFNIVQTVTHARYEDERQRLKNEQVLPSVSVPEPEIAPPPPEAVRSSPQTRREEIDSRNQIEKNVIERYPQKYWPIFRDFIKVVNEKGYWVKMGSDYGVRNDEEQRKVQNGFNAPVGRSPHQFSIAIDIHLIDKVTGRETSKDAPPQVWKSTGVVDEADRLGLQWAGGTGNGYFKAKTKGKADYYDPVHFQIKPRVLSAIQKGTYKYSDTPATPDPKPDPPKDVVNKSQAHTAKLAPDPEKLYQYYKVNKSVFNFFINRQQLNPKFRTLDSRTIQTGPQEDVSFFMDPKEYNELGIDKK